MKRTFLAMAIGIATVGVAPAHAGVGDGWIVIDSGTIEGTAPDINPVIDSVIALVTNTAKDKVCTPQASSIAVGGLSWEWLESPDFTQYAFRWYGPGYASVSDDCAKELDLTVEVTDVSPSGDPAAAQGYPGYSWDDTASAGMLYVGATSQDLVLYYDFGRGYVRGVKTVVEIKVTASYYNKKAKSFVPIGCRATHTVVTPTPFGPSDMTTGPVEDCGA